MIAADLLPPPSRELPRHAAARWLAAAVAEFEALETLDPEAVTTDPDPAKVARAGEIHAAWGRWADRAQELFDRIGDDPSLDPDERLMFPARIQAARQMARTDLPKLRRRRAQAEAGDTIDGKELFHELGLP